jgi:hypothetical protein
MTLWTRPIARTGGVERIGEVHDLAAVGRSDGLNEAAEDREGRQVADTRGVIPSRAPARDAQVAGKREHQSAGERTPCTAAIVGTGSFCRRVKIFS